MKSVLSVQYICAAMDLKYANKVADMLRNLTMKFLIGAMKNACLF